MSLCCLNEGGGEVKAEFDAMMQWASSKSKKCFGKKEKLYICHWSNWKSDCARDLVMDATFLHDCFYVHAIAIINVWLHILCPPYR